MNKNTRIFAKMKKVLEAKAADANRIVGNTYVNHSKENFVKEGFVDESLEKWKPRASPDEGRGILTKTGALRRSIRQISNSRKEALIGTKGIPYASRHNFGTGGMPERKFIGESATATKRASGILKKYLITILNQQKR